MDESIDFYTQKLGLTLLDGPFHYPGNADMAFVGRDWNAYIELVYDLEEHPPYALGNRYEHLAIEADGDLEQYIAHRLVDELGETEVGRVAALVEAVRNHDHPAIESLLAEDETFEETEGRPAHEEGRGDHPGQPDKQPS